MTASALLSALGSDLSLLVTLKEICGRRASNVGVDQKLPTLPPSAAMQWRPHQVLLWWAGQASCSCCPTGRQCHSKRRRAAAPLQHHSATAGPAAHLHSEALEEGALRHQDLPQGPHIVGRHPHLQANGSLSQHARREREEDPGPEGPA